MKIDLVALEKRYAEMEEDEWSRLRRQDLSVEARRIFDRVARTRGIPIPETVAGKPEAVAATIEPPNVDEMLRKMKRRMTIAKVRLAIVWIAYMLLGLLLAGKGPGPGDFAIFGILYVFWGTVRGDRPVLWLRRFHVQRKGGLRFGRILEKAASGFGFAITVQDSIVKRSLDMGAAGLQVLFCLMLVVMYVLLLAFRTLFGDHDLLPILLFIAVPAAVCLPIFLRNLVIDLKPENAQRKVLKLMRKIERKSGWHTSGVFLIRCGESFWRQVVELCIQSAAVVVIDVTEISENVIWELQTALRLLGPGSIVLAYGVDEGSAKEFPASRRNELVSSTAGDWFEQAHIYLYPRLKSQLNEEQWHSRKQVTEDLRRLLAEGIANTEYRRQLEDATVPQLSEA